MSEEPHREENITTLSEREYLRLKVIEKANISLMYVIIGYLQEYVGGYSPDDTTVDTFFANEQEKAGLFAKICERYLAEQQLPNDVVLTVCDTGVSCVSSETICAALRRHYCHRKPDFLSNQCYVLSKDNDLFKSAEELYGKTDHTLFNGLQLSFLIGVSIRNRTGEEPTISFANASHKAEMAIGFLKACDAFSDRSFSVTYHFNTPHVTQIGLAPDSLLWEIVQDFTVGFQLPDNGPD